MIPMSNFTAKIMDIQYPAFQAWVDGSRCARMGFSLISTTA